MSGHLWGLLEPSVTDTADGLPVPKRYWAILTIALGLISRIRSTSLSVVSSLGEKTRRLGPLSNRSPGVVPV